MRKLIKRQHSKLRISYFFSNIKNYAIVFTIEKGCLIKTTEIEFFENITCIPLNYPFKMCFYCFFVFDSSVQKLAKIKNNVIILLLRPFQREGNTFLQSFYFNQGLQNKVYEAPKISYISHSEYKIYLPNVPIGTAIIYERI